MSRGPLCPGCWMPIHVTESFCSEECRAGVEARLLREAEAMSDDRYERAIREEMAGRGNALREGGAK